jgi:alanyl-tRNA synthetase
MTELLISYPGGATRERSRVSALTTTVNAVLFAVERTPCHPESPRWPDQPADRCTLEHAGSLIQIECHEGFLLDSGELTLGPLDEGQEGVPCVVHSAAPAATLSPGTAPGPGATPGPEPTLAIGDAVTLSVDESYRAALSRSHSRCHLVTLALNHALAEAWRKDPGTHDSLGSPDFDKLAILSSKIDERGSLDTYRIGKHMRKSGFPAEALHEPEALALRVAETARKWIASRPSIAVTPGVCVLEERRTFSCELPQGTASFPCGGTHAGALLPEDDFTVQIAWEPEARHLTMAVSSATP